MVTVATVIVARADSARLPGKVLLDVGGRALVDVVVDRLRQSPRLEPILATTNREVDDALARHAAARSVRIYRGATENVARRLLEAAHTAGADYVARVNGDSPFVDSALLESALRLIDDGSSPYLVTNLPGRTFPYGVSVEVIRCEVLAALLPSFEQHEREHVTRGLYARLANDDIRTLHSPRPDLAGARMTVDTVADLDRLRQVAGALGNRLVDADWTEAAEVYLSLEAAP